MKFRYWMVVYPFHLSAGAPMQPSVTEYPVGVSGEAKRLSVEIDVPDDLFGDIPVVAQVSSDDTSRTGKE